MAQILKDISGQKFHHLTALYPTDQRDKRGFVIWHCRCDCGKEIDYSYNEIVYCNLRSCGCVKKSHQKVLHQSLTHIDGTSIDLLKSKKTPKNNTTGVKGVYFIRGKYVAKIVFQKKQYILGTFDNLQDAAEAHQEGEEVFRDRVVEFYTRWKAKADKDPQWAQENPMRIFVDRDENHRIRIEFLPKLT